MITNRSRASVHQLATRSPACLACVGAAAIGVLLGLMGPRAFVLTGGATVLALVAGLSSTCTA
jgi:hypothetical protein